MHSTDQEIKVAALVVTYNRLNLLKECLAALENQTNKLDKVIIYDNHSSDGTTEYLNSLNKELFHVELSSNNSGGAGGFHFGINLAWGLGYDWIWVMDDDTIPHQDALKKLIESPFFPANSDGITTGYLASRVDWIDGTRHLMNFIQPIFPWHHFHGKYDNAYRITNSSFVSMLINRQAITKCGLPVKEFFIWGDDWEYTGRISQQFPCFYISDSVVVHKTLENSAAHVENINKMNIWKFRYNARNTTALRPRRGIFFFQEFMIDLLKKMNKMRKSKVKSRYIWDYFHYSIKGLFFNYRKYIKYPDK